MTTINTSSKTSIHCNRCQSMTFHAEQGQCRKLNNFFDEYSRTEINSEETYSLVQCQVCGQARMRIVLWNSENDIGDPKFFPPPRCHRVPDWLHELDKPLRALFSEVYSAIDAGLYSLALMGVRAILDIWASLLTSEENNFSKKLKDLVTVEKISTEQSKVLSTIFDAGSAAAHRGYLPTLSDAIVAVAAMENLLHQHVLEPRIGILMGNTPKRIRK